MIRIPIVDLQRHYRALARELRPAIEAVLESGHFIKGEPLKRFEEQMAEYLGTGFAIGLNSGTDALFLALKALGIGPGDKVVVPAMSFVATAEAVSLAGAEPVFVDIVCGPDLLDLQQLEAAIDGRTRAVIPVHLHGYPCDMEAILAIARRHDLAVIEDCAQATGALYRGQKVGSFGDIGCFSFFPTKNLGCFGDGGLAVTSDAGLADRLRCLREHGSRVKNFQDMLGINSRLDTLQAAILQVMLPHLDSWNQRRRELARYYDALLQDLPVSRPPLEISADTASVFHHYNLRVPQRDAVQQAMQADGIECLSYYPNPLHRQGLYQERWPLGSFPQAERAAREGLSLPMFPELTHQEQEAIAEALRAALG